MHLRLDGLALEAQAMSTVRPYMSEAFMLAPNSTNNSIISYNPRWTEMISGVTLSCEQCEGRARAGSISY